MADKSEAEKLGCHSKEKNKPRYREWEGHSPYNKAVAKTAKTSAPR